MFIANLLEALRKRGHRVRIVSRVDVRDFWRGRLPARRLIAEAALVRGDMKRFLPDAWLVYAPRVQYPDLLGWWQRPGKYVLLGCEASSRRSVQVLPRPWRDLFTFAHRQSLQRADKIVAVRPGVARNLRSWGVPDERACFLPLAIKAWTRVPCREEARRVLGLPPETPILLCVSRLAVRSGKDDLVPSKTEAILDLLRAFRALPSNVLLLLVGEGPGRRQIEQEAARLKLDGRVRFAGTVEHSDINWFYAACDFFAFPEKAEGNAPYQALLEAQVCGRPVVTMQTDLTQLTVEAGRTGLLARDLNELPAHLLALVQDRNRCAEMGRAAAAFVTRCFSIEARARQIEELLLS
jgi:glycosyltransferase involved in cell wall biosynthesis